jgi:DNA-binding transcriptional regulator GbsR (MarR family)
MSVRNTAPPATDSLAEMEREVIALFVRLADLIGLPRSAGELYGALFFSPRPMHMDELRARLNMSKGATSQGLRLLRGFGAVNLARLPGDRRDYFAAETQLRRLVGGFLRQQVQPHLRSGAERMDLLRRLLEDVPPKDRAFVAERVERLANWQRRSERLLPMVMKLIRV